MSDYDYDYDAGMDQLAEWRDEQFMDEYYEKEFHEYQTRIYGCGILSKAEEYGQVAFTPPHSDRRSPNTTNLVGEPKEASPPTLWPPEKEEKKLVEGKDVGIPVHDDLESQINQQNTEQSTEYILQESEQKKSPICAEICVNIMKHSEEVFPTTHR